MSSSENPKVDPSDLLEATKRDLREACDTVYELSAELGELRAQFDAINEEVQVTRQWNLTIVNSFTWKFVHLLLTPKRLLVRFLNIRGK